MTSLINLHNPIFSKKEIRNLINCVKSGWVTNKGDYVELFKKKIKKITKAKYVVPTINGTSALQISLKLAGVKENEEVIVSTLTYVATINAIRYVGASPIFLDVEDDLNISITKLQDFLVNQTIQKSDGIYNKKTKKKISAIIIVHIFGNAVDVKPVLKLCKEKKIKLIEDAAESLGTYYTKKYLNKKHTGTIGNFGCLSFNGNKIITAAGGGAILINNKKDYEYCNYLCDQAKDDSIHFIHNEVGFNYKLSNLQSALGCAQVDKLNKYLQKKKNIHKNYINLFNNHEKFNILKSQNFYESNHWLNILIIKQNKKINLSKLIKAFAKKGIETRPIWKLNHTQLPFKKFQKFKIKRSIKFVKNHLCLPSSPDLKFKDQKKIFEIINSL